MFSKIFTVLILSAISFNSLALGLDTPKLLNSVEVIDKKIALYKAEQAFYQNLLAQSKQDLKREKRVALVSKTLGAVGVTIVGGYLAYGAYAIAGLGTAAEAAALKAAALGVGAVLVGGDVYVLVHRPHSKENPEFQERTPVAQFPLDQFLKNATQVPIELLKNRAEVDSKIKAYLETQEGFNFLNAKGIRREEALVAWFKYAVEFDQAVIDQFEANKREILHLAQQNQ